MWREYIQSLSNEAEFNSPASVAEIDRIEEKLNQRVPEPLRSFLLESNGVSGKYGTNIVWSADKIIEDNAFFRTDETFAELYMSFSSLMFFGDNAGGDQFAFILIKSRGEDIFAWDHETDERIMVSGSFKDYLARCFSVDTAGTDWHRN